MSLKQRISIIKRETSHRKISVRDETGQYSASNPNGYGGVNGSPIENIARYIFNIVDKVTGEVVFTKIIEATAETGLTAEAVARYALVDLVPSLRFSDSIYVVQTYVVFKSEYACTSVVGEDVLLNVAGISGLEAYQAIYDPLTKTVLDVARFLPQQGAVILEKPVVTAFRVFSPVRRVTTDPLLVTQELEDKIDTMLLKEINAGGECPEQGSDSYNIRLVYWAMKRAIDKEDYPLAINYFKRLKNLVDYSNCGCHG